MADLNYPYPGGVPRKSRIYPVPVKPASSINSWGHWPEDCEPRIREIVAGFYPTGGVFKCSICELFCQPHQYGVPHLNKATREVLCDDCLIELARRG